MAVVAKLYRNLAYNGAITLSFGEGYRSGCPLHPHNRRSSVRYWIASATCPTSISADPARSAVRYPALMAAVWYLEFGQDGRTRPLAASSKSFE
jgi:hypothetical protein